MESRRTMQFSLRALLIAVAVTAIAVVEVPRMMQGSIATWGRAAAETDALVRERRETGRGAFGTSYEARMREIGR